MREDSVLEELSLMGMISTGLALLALRAQHWVPRFLGSPLLILVLATVGGALPWLATLRTGVAWTEPRLAIAAAALDAAAFSIVGAMLAFAPPENPERLAAYNQGAGGPALARAVLTTPEGKLGGSLGESLGLGGVLTVLTLQCPGMDADSAMLLLVIGGLVGGMSAASILYLAGGLVGEILGRLRRR